MPARPQGTAAHLSPAGCSCRRPKYRHTADEPGFSPAPHVWQQMTPTSACGPNSGWVPAQPARPPPAMQELSLCFTPHPAPRPAADPPGPRRGWLCPPWLVAAWDAAAGSSITLEIADTQRANVQINESVNSAESLSFPGSQTYPALLRCAAPPPHPGTGNSRAAHRAVMGSQGGSEVQHGLSLVPARCSVGHCPCTAHAQGSTAQP